jgi:hypothetical protein
VGAGFFLKSALIEDHALKVHLNIHAVGNGWNAERD